MSPWEWITTTTSVETLFTTLGLGSLAILFATDRILTKGQHLRQIQALVKAQDERVADMVEAHEQRIADLSAHHTRELVEKDSRIADVIESRDGWKEAARLERERADKVTAAFTDVAGAVTDIQHVLESLDRALPSPGGPA